MAAPLLENL